MNRLPQSCRPGASLVLAAALTACHSAPIHYYSLLPAAEASRSEAAAAALQFELLPIDVPAQVDRSDMVVRLPDGELVPVDTRQWAAPLADELHAALALALSRTLNAHDVDGLPHDAALPTFRIKLSIDRFDSALGDRAGVDATWSVQRIGNAAITVCDSHWTQAVAPGYEALAAGHRKAIAAIAEQIATVIRGTRQPAGVGTCPSAVD